MQSWVELDTLGRRQWGLVTRQQVLEVMSSDELRHRQHSGQLVPVHRGVYRLAGNPPSWRQRAMASCLAYGPPSALSHRAAARLWRLEGIAAEVPEVTVPRGRDGRREGIVTHRAPLPAADVTRRDGIPLTTPSRTLVDLASLLPVEVLGRALDQAHRLRLTTPEELQRALGSRGRVKGGHVLRQLLALRLPHPGVGDSEWADRVFRAIVAAGLEPPERQVRVTVNGSARVLDMAYPERMIAVEFDGFDYHGRRHRFDADAERYTELALAGWLAIRLTARRPLAEAVDQVRRALELRRPGWASGAA